jgi:glutamine amidotransferase
METVERLSGPRTLMVHLRKASVGRPSPANSHPFVIDGRAFMHNGSVKGLASAFSASRKPVGQTDSEMFFLMLLDDLAGHGVPRALAKTITRLESLEYSSLTFIMQDGPDLYAFRLCSRYEDYYTLYYSQLQDSVVFASEPLRGLRWQPIRNGELVRASVEGRRPVVERQLVARSTA